MLFHYANSDIFSFDIVLPPVLVPRHSEYPCMGPVAAGLSTNPSGQNPMPPPLSAPLLMASPYCQPTSNESSMPYNVTFPQGFPQTSPLPSNTPINTGASPSVSLPHPPGTISDIFALCLSQHAVFSINGILFSKQVSTLSFCRSK